MDESWVAIDASAQTRKIAIDIGVRNFAVCRIHGTTVTYCNKFAIGTTKQPMNELIDCLIRKFEAEPGTFLEVDEVVIEQQKGHLAVKNFALSTAVYAFYTSRHVSTRFENPTVKFKKLKDLKKSCEISALENLDFEQKGKALKKLAIEAAAVLANHYDHTVYNTAVGLNRKVDDLADSFLMAIL